MVASRVISVAAAVLAAGYMATSAFAQEAPPVDAFEQLQRDLERQQQQLGIEPDAAPDSELEQLPDPFAAPEAPDQLVPQIEAAPEPEPEPERVKNPVAVFSGLDKITGRITSFDVYIDETVQFGALQVTPRVCITSPAGTAARTDAFVQVDEITLQREIQQIFSGWMFADSPGLNAVEHPVYDVWLKSCKTDSDVPAPEG